MKRICNFILLLCLVQLAVAQNRIAEIRENLLGNHPDKILVVSHRADWRNARKTHCKVYRIALIWVSIWWRSI